MIHYSCDRCKREINPDAELRYVVYVEVRPVLETEVSDNFEDDDDSLLELHEILERLEEEEAAGTEHEEPARKRFDLCPECYRRYIKNPVGGEASLPIGFSHN